MVEGRLRARAHAHHAHTHTHTHAHAHTDPGAAVRRRQSGGQLCFFCGGAKPAPHLLGAHVICENAHLFLECAEDSSKAKQNTYFFWSAAARRPPPAARKPLSNTKRSPLLLRAGAREFNSLSYCPLAKKYSKDKGGRVWARGGSRGGQPHLPHTRRQLAGALTLSAAARPPPAAAAAGRAPARGVPWDVVLRFVRVSGALYATAAQKAYGYASFSDIPPAPLPKTSGCLHCEPRQSASLHIPRVLAFLARILVPNHNSHSDSSLRATLLCAVQSTHPARSITAPSRPFLRPHPAIQPDLKTNAFKRRR